MRVLAFCLSLSIAASSAAQTYFKPEANFGMTAGKAVSMGAEDFVAWYCAPARGGAAAEAGAENAFALALYDRTQARMAYQLAGDRKFYDDIRVNLADLAKSSVTTGITFAGPAHASSEKWSVAMARSSRMVNEAIWQMVRPSLAIETTPDALDKIAAIGERVMAFGELRGFSRETGTGRVAFLSGYILERCSKRSNREQRILENAVLRLGSLALLDDKRSSRR